MSRHFELLLCIFGSIDGRECRYSGRLMRMLREGMMIGMCFRVNMPYLVLILYKQNSLSKMKNISNIFGHIVNRQCYSRTNNRWGRGSGKSS